MPAKLFDVEEIVSIELTRCSVAQLRIWEQCRVEFRTAEIVRYGLQDSVYVVAELDGRVVYWEDVEEGFNISRLGCRGEIVEHHCNQDELGWALDALVR